MCGKNVTYGLKNIRGVGSPPRVREKLNAMFIEITNNRITPACAGKTSRNGSDGTGDWDHPRVCGKNGPLMGGSDSCQGSPPRVREKPVPSEPLREPNRITPACAGKTMLSGIAQCGYWDHPRVCGKNGYKSMLATPESGSPPRVREKPVRCLHEPRRGGITPACAGKTDTILYMTVPNEDHPRVCGKNAKADYDAKLSAGSPPRVREKLRPVIKLSVTVGITPACAGKTPSKWLDGLNCRDHPRVCGKNCCWLVCDSTILGSPPRVREKHSFKHS